MYDNVFPVFYSAFLAQNACKKRKTAFLWTFGGGSTGCGHRMAHIKWKETKQQPSMLPGPAAPGRWFVSFNFLLAILRPHPVQL